jgi:serine/threonine protein kinase
MSEVYEGIHRAIGSRVAIKLLLPEVARLPQAVQRFENEARIAGRLQHENIAKVYDFGVHADSSHYIVMELLDGEDLERLLRRDGPLPLVRAADLVIQACRALDAVHRCGSLHRDLKPGNLFLIRRADGTDLLKVLDFGIAKLLTSERGITRSGAAIGTAYYMSPEQARGDRNIDARSDVYSLGAILYELVSGRRPHEGQSLLQVLHNVATKDPAPLEAACAHLPSSFHAVVNQALARTVEERFSGAPAMAAALRPFSRSVPVAEAAALDVFLATRDSEDVAPEGGKTLEPTATLGRLRTPSPPGVHRRRSRLLAIGGAAAGVALALAGVRYAGGPRSPSSSAASGRVEPPPSATLAAAEAPSGRWTPSASGHAAPPPSDSASAPPPPSPAPRAPDPVSPSPPAPPQPLTATPVAPRPSSFRPTGGPCEPPYFFDARGVRIFKKDCPL